MKCNSLTVTNNSNSFNMTIKRNDDERIKSLSPKQDSNHLRIKVNKSSLGTERIISKYSELKHSNKKLQNVRLVKTQVNENKDLEIDHLNEEIESYKVSNYELQCKIEAKLNERNDLELEQKEIAHYCNDLKAKFNNIEKTV